MSPKLAGLGIPAQYHDALCLFMAGVSARGFAEGQDAGIDLAAMSVKMFAEGTKVETARKVLMIVAEELPKLKK